MDATVTVIPQAALLLTIGSTSEELGIPKTKLRKMRRAGTGPQFTVLTRKTILYYRVAVLEWKQAQPKAA